eukprot:m.597691 g.597691  ORF g.597691 m.597691 type:complete len:193 (-) comp22417_c0_seq4:3284-3862(-)
MAEALGRLIKAPSKEFVKELFQTAFTCGNNPVPQTVVKKCAEVMELEDSDVAEVFVAISDIIKTTLFENVSTKEGIVKLLPAGLEERLQALVVSVVSKNLKQWRLQSASNELSLPALKEFDWRIDIKSASDKVARMSVPTALVQMKVEDVATRKDEMAQMRSIDFEVNRDTLTTMLDGMGKILGQLNSAAGQ